jgi:hypothetical protein
MRAVGARATALLAICIVIRPGAIITTQCVCTLGEKEAKVLLALYNT